MAGGCPALTLRGLEPDTEQMICCVESNDSGSHETLELLTIDGWEEAGIPP